MCKNFFFFNGSNDCIFRGITMDVGLTRFETSHRLVTLLDAPGHKDFIPNMITGAAQVMIIIIAAFIMRTYPSSEDVQGATYYYYTGHWIHFEDHTYITQFPLPREHSVPSCLSWRSGKYIHNISFTSYRVPIYTPGWRAAMWIECLGEGRKCQALTRIEPTTL